MKMAPKKRASTLSYHNLISFIPGTESESVGKKHTAVNTSKCGGETESLGREVRSFYENLSKDDHQNKRVRNTNDSGTDGLPPRKARKHLNSKFSSSSNTKASSNDVSNSNNFNTETKQINVISNQLDPKMRQHFKLLQRAQLGDLDSVRDLLNNREKSLDVNFTDFYGWTPLMCAAKEGHVNVVKFFLNCGANKHHCNLSGDTALSIARSAGHLAVVSVLESYDCELDREEQNNDHNSSPASFHCSVCKKDFSEEEKKSHMTSTVHLFNSGHRSNVPSYFIPNSNRGFQMLLRSGWNSQCGLGPEGKGRKYPVKTVLKQDRAGIGREDKKLKKAKVTHFNQGDVEAVKINKNPNRLISVRKAARNAARSKERKSRRWEQNLRFELN